MLRSTPSTLLRSLDQITLSSALLRSLPLRAYSTAPDSTHVAQSSARPRTLSEKTERMPDANAAFARAVAQPVAAHLRRSGPGGAIGGEGKVVPRFGALATRLRATRKASGAPVDEAAKQIEAIPAPVPRQSRGGEGRSGERAPTSRMGTMRRAGGPTPEREGMRMPGTGNQRSPSSPVSAGGRPAPRGPPRANSKPKPRFDKSNSTSSASSSSVTPTPNPVRFTPFAPLNIASLIRQELAAGTLELTASRGGRSQKSAAVKGTANARSAEYLKGKEGEQAERIKALKELQGDYSRYFYNGASGSKGSQVHVNHLRRVLNSNASVGVVETDFLATKVAELLPKH